MKKVSAFFLALILTLSMTAFALGGSTTTLEFADFTLTIDSTTQYEQADLTEGAAFLVLYPDMGGSSQFATNLNFLWQSSYANLNSWSDSDLKSWAESTLSSALEEFEKLGLTASNIETFEPKFTTVDGKRALYVAYRYDVDFSGMGAAYKGYVVNVCSCQWVISESGMGTYYITGSCTTPAEFETVCQPVIDGLRWK